MMTLRQLAVEYQRAHVFCLPSVQEGFGIVFLEAMAAGKPVIASAIPGNDEAVDHAQTGWLVPPGDADALAKAIRLLLADPILAQRLASAGQASAQQEFSSQAMIRQVEQVREAGLAGLLDEDPDRCLAAIDRGDGLLAGRDEERPEAVDVPLRDPVRRVEGQGRLIGGQRGDEEHGGEEGTHGGIAAGPRRPGKGVVSIAGPRFARAARRRDNGP